jgi:hypothetical protein
MYHVSDCNATRPSLYVHPSSPHAHACTHLFFSFRFECRRLSVPFDLTSSPNERSSHSNTMPRYCWKNGRVRAGKRVGLGRLGVGKRASSMYKYFIGGNVCTSVGGMKETIV